MNFTKYWIFECKANEKVILVLEMHSFMIWMEIKSHLKRHEGETWENSCKNTLITIETYHHKISINTAIKKKHTEMKEMQYKITTVDYLKKLEEVRRQVHKFQFWAWRTLFKITNNVKENTSDTKMENKSLHYSDKRHCNSPC